MTTPNMTNDSNLGADATGATFNPTDFDKKQAKKEYSNRFERFFKKRGAIKDFIETESYEDEINSIWKANPISRYQRMTVGFFTITVVVAVLFGGIFCYLNVIAMIATAFGEFKAIRRDTRNLTPEAEERLKNTEDFTQALYLSLPVMVMTGISYMWLATSPETSLFEQIGLVLSGAYAFAVLGINVGHELVHRRDKFESNFGGVLLALVCYGTFKVEHVRGHHVYVSTPEDASSAPLGMSLYKFLPRAWVMNPINGFKLEAKRLKGLGKSAWSVENELIWWTAMSVAIALLSYLTFGLGGLVFFLLQSFLAITLLEIINYVEHYGLERQKLENGRYERVTEHHSWNASEQTTNIVMFNLQRHSDHHANPTRPFQLLRHFDESPQLPTGYFGMLYLAMWPSKWFKVMNPRAEAYMAYIKEQREANDGVLKRGI